LDNENATLCNFPRQLQDSCPLTLAHPSWKKEATSKQKCWTFMLAKEEENDQENLQTQDSKK